MCLPEGGERDSHTSMALDAAAVFPQDYPFGYASSSLWPFHDDFNHPKYQEDHHQQQQGFLNFLDNQSETNNYDLGDYWQQTHVCSPSSSVLPHTGVPSNSDTICNTLAPSSSEARPKRRRARTRKNQEEIENQRMTHIAVERNRRKQMNEYLSVLRSLMPDSYVQRVLIPPYSHYYIY